MKIEEIEEIEVDLKVEGFKGFVTIGSLNKNCNILP